MSAHHSQILTDDSKLSRADCLLFRLESLCNFLGGAVIFLLVFLATCNVLGRWIFSVPVSGYIDWVEQFMAFIAFLGIAYTMRLGGHIRMDIVIGRVTGRRLWAAEFISTLMMLVFTIILIIGSYLHFLRAYQIGDSSMDINLPTWPAKFIVSISLCVLAVRLMLQLWAYGRAWRTNSNDPVAVPLIESAAEIAAKEAQMTQQVTDSTVNTR